MDEQNKKKREIQKKHIEHQLSMVRRQESILKNKIAELMAKGKDLGLLEIHLNKDLASYKLEDIGDSASDLKNEVMKKLNENEGVKTFIGSLKNKFEEMKESLSSKESAQDSSSNEQKEHFQNQLDILKTSKVEMMNVRNGARARYNETENKENQLEEQLKSIENIGGPAVDDLKKTIADVIAEKDKFGAKIEEYNRKLASIESQIQDLESRIGG
jgi:chromosome segregation ATPase